MPSDKKTSPERSRSATAQRPPRPAQPGSLPPNLPNRGRPSRPEKRGPSIKAIGENIGWGLVIGLPIILVILAILWRATNGFQGTPNTDTTAPTPVPTATAGAFVAPPAASGNKDRIVYLQAANASSPMQLFSAKQDGSDVIQLTNSPENKANPVWSPDGKQIAFQADNSGINLINLDGSGLHTLAYGGYGPVWSPDGKQIAFLENQPATDGQGPDRTGTVRVLYVTPVTGKPGDEKQLAADVLGQNWSPDSKSLAFFSLRNAVMFTVDVASAKTTQISVPDKLGGWYPTFAPDGKSLVFYGNPNPGIMVSSLDLAVTSGGPDADSITPLATPSPVGTTLPAAPATPVPSQGPGTPTSGAQAPATPGITVGSGSPAATTLAASPSPTAVPGPSPQTSLYTINPDGSGLKKLQDLEPLGGGGKFRFSYYIATSADIVSVLSARPYYKVGPVFAPDGKSVAALYVSAENKTGLAVVHPDGSPTSLLIDGQNGLEVGTRLSPAFASDNSRLFYTFLPTKPATATKTATPGQASLPVATPAPLKQSRYFDLNAKAEKPLLTQNDNSYLQCCGFRKS